MNSLKNTYIKLKGSDKTAERIKEIADKYSQASGMPLEAYLESDSFDNDYLVPWKFLVIEKHAVEVWDAGYDLTDMKEITEQDLDNYLLTKNHISEGDDKECCEDVVSNEDDILNNVTKWACFQQVADVIGEEGAEFELNKVKVKHLDGCMKVHTEADLGTSFSWEHSPQGDNFWNDIDDLLLPDEYKKEPFKPTLVIDDDVLDRMKDTFNDDFSDNDNDDNKDAIGSLVERLYTSLSPSNINISVNGSGQILLHGDKIPTVDITRLEADEITKAYEAMVMLEGLFLEYDGE